MYDILSDAFAQGFDLTLKFLDLIVQIIGDILLNIVAVVTDVIRDNILNLISVHQVVVADITLDQVIDRIPVHQLQAISNSLDLITHIKIAHHLPCYRIDINGFFSRLPCRTLTAFEQCLSELVLIERHLCEVIHRCGLVSHHIVHLLVLSAHQFHVSTQGFHIVEMGTHDVCYQHYIFKKFI